MKSLINKQDLVELMKFLSFNHEGNSYFGGVKDNGIVNLTLRAEGLIDLREAIRKNKLDDLTKLVNTSDSDYSVDEIEFIPTIPNPEKIIDFTKKKLNLGAFEQLFFYYKLNLLNLSLIHI